MALIDCPECDTQVSTNAAACPACAFPIGKRARAGSRTGSNAGAGRGYVASGLEVTKQIISRMAVGGALFVSGVAWEAPPVVLISILIGGSCLPIWVKARRAERLGSGRGDRAVEGRMEQKLADLEERYMQQLAEVEENGHRQLAEMEERLDFAERLLTRGRDAGASE